MKKAWLHRTIVMVILCCSACSLSAQALQPGKNSIVLRGQSQTLEYFPAVGRSAGKVLFAPGDIGTIGFARTIANTIAADGYDVYALDTRRYLSSFTGKTNLKESEIQADMHDIARRISESSAGPMSLVGWSEGAGLMLLAISAPQNREYFDGLITLGLPETNALAWHWTDLVSSLVSSKAKEPMFTSADYLPRIAPAPFVLIQSTHDQYVRNDVARHMFDVAKEPKRWQLIDASNHRFEGNQDALFAAIGSSLRWFNELRNKKAPPVEEALSGHLMNYRGSETIRPSGLAVSR